MSKCLFNFTPASQVSAKNCDISRDSHKMLAAQHGVLMLEIIYRSFQLFRLSLIWTH